MDLISRHRGVIGYVILAATIAVALFLVSARDAKRTSNQVDRRIRHDINLLASKACRTSTRAFILKHNALVNEIVAVRTAQAKREAAAGQTAASVADRQAAVRYGAKRIHVPTDRECAKPILQPK